LGWNWSREVTLYHVTRHVTYMRDTGGSRRRHSDTEITEGTSQEVNNSSLTIPRAGESVRPISVKYSRPRVPWVLEMET
jgi:hypothetical protein